MSKKSSQKNFEACQIFDKIYEGLEVYRLAFDGAVMLMELSRDFPLDELTNQIRKSSKCVCANIEAAWSERRNRSIFISKMSNAESEAIETLTWIDFSIKQGYLRPNDSKGVQNIYNHLIHKLQYMINNNQ